MRTYDALIFELSQPGRTAFSLPAPAPGGPLPDALGAEHLRPEPPALPEVSELDVVRHYTNLSRLNHGVETGFYPLGSCTMKYNPRINEEVAAMPAFNRLHPLQPADTLQGVLQIYDDLQRMLAEISGLYAFSLNPCAGAHGELAGLMIMKAFHARNGARQRTRVIVPDSAHGTNPASTAVCGMEVVEIKSNARGRVDLAALDAALAEGDRVAGMMLTNPNTLGIFENEVLEITRRVHAAGGLMYYDGANLNAILGKARPGDMGFDIMHINLHKTFATPHGGGGPGAGPVGVRKGLEDLLPNPRVRRQDGRYAIEESPDAIGRITAFFGNFKVWLRAYAYLRTLGRENLADLGALATLNANYVQEALRGEYRLPIDGRCMHECVFDGLARTAEGVTTLDVAKRLLDFGMHAPTIYFPLLFRQSLMIEPTETESKQTLDRFIQAMKDIAREAREQPERLREAPRTTPVRRVDEVYAARKMLLTYRDYLEERAREPPA